MPYLQTRESCEVLLALWERGLEHPVDARGDALLAAQDATAPRTLGERTLRLLKTHMALFGPEIVLLSHCPSCAAVSRFASDCQALIAGLPSATLDSTHRLEVNELAIEFRVPDATDLAAASREPTDEAFARHVLGRCVLACMRGGETVPVGDLTDEILDALSRRMESLDPGASLAFSIQCPDCATAWSAVLDVGELLWQKVQASVERMFLEVDALARVYGWTEREVLELSPARRAAYLQIVTA